MKAAPGEFAQYRSHMSRPVDDRHAPFRAVVELRRQALDQPVVPGIDNALIYRLQGRAPAQYLVGRPEIFETKVLGEALARREEAPVQADKWRRDKEQGAHGQRYLAPFAMKLVRRQVRIDDSSCNAILRRRFGCRTNPSFLKLIHR